GLFKAFKSLAIFKSKGMTEDSLQEPVLSIHHVVTGGSNSDQQVWWYPRLVYTLDDKNKKLRMWRQELQCLCRLDPG
ncbi:mCG144686, partial [Mus musculus]